MDDSDSERSRVDVGGIVVSFWSFSLFGFCFGDLCYSGKSCEMLRLDGLANLLSCLILEVHGCLARLGFINHTQALLLGQIKGELVEAG